MPRDPYDWVMGAAASMDEYGQPIVPVVPGALAEQPQPVMGPPGQLAEQPSYDPFAAAAARVRFGAKPAGGRQVGGATTVLDILPEHILSAPKRAFSVSEAWRQGERTPEMAGELFNTTLDVANVGVPFSQAGALGSGGGKAVMGELAAQPPFYSAVERAVQGSKQPSAPGQQWLSTLRNQPGIKPDEISALGLEEFFSGQQGPVSKQALLDRIAANKLEVEEVVKGAPASPEVIDAAKRAYKEFDDYSELLGEKYGIHTSHNMAMYGRVKNMDPAEVAKYEQLQRRYIETKKASEAEPTKFGSYTLPGGENYREMLLTLPRENSELVAVQKRINDITMMPASEHARLGEKLRTEFDMLRDREYQLKAQQPSQFTSSHYDEPNILAHVRTNDRVIDGKKTLFVEEVQSDWHQAGKKRGYQGGDDTQLPTGWRVDRPDPTNHPNAWALFDGNGERGSRFWADSAEEATRLGLERNRNLEGKVPDAPFKTTWPELAMKRVIREAAEKGYDKVAWTPGSVQAERYDLSKHINQLDLTHNRDGVGKLGMTLKDGSRQYVDITSKENLADTVGKDVAEKLYKQGAENNGIAVLSGLDLKVGGEGMKGFYDEILPATVNKLIKKHGGRVGRETLAGSIEVVPSEGGWSVINNGRDVGFYETRGLANEIANELKQTAQGSSAAAVHTIDITPQLREAAMKGFPLFTVGGVAATGVIGELARQDEYRQ